MTLRRRARLTQAFAPQAAQAASGDSGLNIGELRLFPLKEPVSGNRYTLLRVRTNSGLTGWGECVSDTAPGDAKSLETDWKGKPAYRYAAIDPAAPFAGALDMALLDILGHACKAPVYRVLGGPTRAKVRAFGSPGSGGFPVVLLPLPPPAARNQGKAYQLRVKALVEGVPENADFILSGDGLLTPGDAASVAAAAESKHPLWFDEPCNCSNAEAIRKISAETVTPLGFGRTLRDPGHFQALLREGLVDIVRPDLSHFGISGVKRIAALAEPYYVAVAPHHAGGPVGTAAALHAAAAIPNFFAQHVPVPLAPEDAAMRAELCSPPPEKGSGGFLPLTSGFGLGITVNEAALEKYRAS